MMFSGIPSRVFAIKNPKHADYWADQAFPVLLVIRSSSGTIEWMEIRGHLCQLRANGDWPIRQIDFKGQRNHSLSLRLREEEP
jgi:hypothetical protein